MFLPFFFTANRLNYASIAPNCLLPLGQDHAKDAKFLNVPIVNYQFMQTIFGSGVATGHFAMGSNEALGQPSQQDTRPGH
jgi:hypothetical protein